MTGLDTLNDTIIEIATIVTDSELNIPAEGPSLPSIPLTLCSTAWMIGTRANMGNQD